MSVPGETPAPVIIKRKKVSGGGGHHGGAWKVAYADFVTAMMAFFLLMWLLNATTEQQRKGIADYFSPMIPLSRVSGGGDGAFGGESVFSEENLPENGTGGLNRMPAEKTQPIGSTGIGSEGQDTLVPVQNQAAGAFGAPSDPSDPDLVEIAEADALKVAQIEKQFVGVSGEGPGSEESQDHLAAGISDEGIVIEVFDVEGSPLFEDETATPTPLLEELAEVVASVLTDSVENLAVEGFVRSVPIVVQDSPVWDLSMQRASVMRQLLEQAGTPSARFRRVTGHADREPVTANKLQARNNRIEVILLRETDR